MDLLLLLTDLILLIWCWSFYCSTGYSHQMPHTHMLNVSNFLANSCSITKSNNRCWCGCNMKEDKMRDILTCCSCSLLFCTLCDKINLGQKVLYICLSALSKFFHVRLQQKEDGVSSATILLAHSKSSDISLTDIIHILCLWMKAAIFSLRFPFTTNNISFIRINEIVALLNA